MGGELIRRDDGQRVSQYDYLQHMRILVVDPSSFMRRTIVGILRFFGCTTYREASDGASALELLRTWQADMILTEYAMDPLDGVDMTRVLRAEAGDLRYIPIIMVSAWSEGWRVCQARDSGVTEFVVKPFSARGLMLRILEPALHPRQFVLAPHYVGPDRRRRLADRPEAPTRRRGDPELAEQRAPVPRGHVTQEEADRLIAREGLLVDRPRPGTGATPTARAAE